MTQPEAARASGKKLPAGVLKIALVVSLGPFLSNLDATVVNVSLSTLSRDLQSPLTTIQWVISGYLLSLALILPLSGWLVDRIGAKRVYLGCFSAFTLASMLCGMANSIGMLIAFRVLQGVSGGLLAPMAQMMAARIAPGQVARVMGLVAMPVMLGPILGPLLAGVILQHASWRWIFFINLPVGVLATFLAWWVFPRDADETHPRAFDLLGFALLSPALVMLLHSLDRLGDGEGGVKLYIAEMVLAVILLGAFLLHAVRRGRSALIDVRLFRARTFSAAAMTQFLSNCIVYGGQVILPLSLLLVGGKSSSEVGFLLAPTGIGMLIAYPLMGAMTERFGPRRVSSGGALLALVGTLPLAFVTASNLPIPIFCLALFVRGLGLGSINVPSIAAAYTGIAKETIPIATTAINIVQRFGGPVATTVLAIFLHARMSTLPSDPPFAFLATFRLLCAIHLLTLFAALRLPRQVVASSAMADATAEAMVE